MDPSSPLLLWALLPACALALLAAYGLERWLHARRGATPQLSSVVWLMASLLVARHLDGTLLALLVGALLLTSLGVSLRTRRPPRSADVRAGLLRLLTALVKLWVVLPALTAISDAAFALPVVQLSGPVVVLGAVSCTAAVVLWFSAAGDLAVGFGRVVGLAVRENLAHPLGAASVTEFWRRYQMALRGWLGAEQAPWWWVVVGVGVVHAISLGARGQLLWWGVFHAGLLSLERALHAEARATTPLRRAFTVLLVTVGFVLLRAPSAHHAAGFLAALVVPVGEGMPWSFMDALTAPNVLVLALTLVVLVLPESPALAARVRVPARVTLVALSAWALAGVAAPTHVQPFKDAALYRVFRQSPRPQEIVIGANSAGGDVWFRRAPLTQAPEPARVLEALRRIEGAFADARVPLVIAISPSKASMDPALLPPPARRAYGESVDALVRALRVHAKTDTALLDLWRSAWNEERRRAADPDIAPPLRALFRAHDEQWNLEGGRVQARLIVESLQPGLWREALAPRLTDALQEVESELSQQVLHLQDRQPYATLVDSPDARLSIQATQIGDGATVVHARSAAPGAASSITTLAVIHAPAFGADASSAGPARDGGLRTVAPFFRHSVFVPWDALAAHAKQCIDEMKEADAVVIQVPQSELGLLLSHERALQRVARALKRAPPAAETP